MDYIKKYAKNSLVVSILLIVLSLFLIIKPAQSLNFIMICLGCIVVLNGIIHTISYFTTPSEFKTFSFELVQGIICIVLGLVFILNPELINSFLPFIIGAWIIIESIVKIQLAFNVKDIQNSNWLLMLGLAIITLLLGIIIIFNPFATAITITTLCGIMLLISEVMNIGESIYFMRRM